MKTENTKQTAYSMPVYVHSTIVDRWEGMSQTFEVWGDTPNSRYVAKGLANVDDRNEVARFFITRGFALVLKSLIKVRTIKPEDCVLTKSELFTALCEHLTVAQAGIVMELILPALSNLGLMVNNMRYSTHIRYGFDPVTTDQVRDDVSVYQIMQAVKSTTKTSLDRSMKYSPAAMAEILSEDFRKIGLEMYEVNDMASIVSDMVAGVRAAIDPELSGDAIGGSVPNDWRNSRVVEELSKNLVFIKAAIELPVGSPITIKSEGWKLDKWAPIILSAIQSSERYAWISKAEALRAYGLSKTRDTKGRVHNAVVYRAAKTVPIAQAVFALEDSLMPGAMNLNATKDRIAEVIQSAYGDADFNTAESAMLYRSVLSDAVEAGWTSGQSVTNFAWSCSTEEICCLLADRLYVTLPARNDDGSVSNMQWRYVVPTTEKDFVFDITPDTEMRGDEVSTSSVDVAILAHNEFSPIDVAPAKPQVFGPAAFNTRVVNYDERTVHRNDSRFAFYVSINSVSMRGNIRPSDFASMRTSDLTSVVVPHFNQLVISETLTALESCVELLNKMRRSTEAQWSYAKPSEQFFTLLERRVARFILGLAQKLSPGFRRDVNNAIIDRTISGTPNLTPDQGTVMRAQLMQRAYAACADVLSFHFFLFVQGMDDQRWQDLITQDDMLKIYLEIGSDRSKLE